jgi:hypothetical protein
VLEALMAQLGTFRTEVEKAVEAQADATAEHGAGSYQEQAAARAWLHASQRYDAARLMYHVALGITTGSTWKSRG